MREKLLELETAARILEPLAPERAAVRDQVISYSEDFLDRIDDVNAFNTSTDKGAGLLNSPISETG